uniref:Uncharacterized protein n=1 Tax=Salix viminalis TaxID=40686 RepID=A0A6N2K945_SALVM
MHRLAECRKLLTSRENKIEATETSVKVKKALEDDQKQQLIPGLPDEIAMDLPYWATLDFSSFLLSTNFSTTSTTDDDPLITSSSNKIFKNRDEQEQQHIHSPPQYALSIYNATHNIWQRTRPPEGSGIPMFCQCLALPSSGKLLLHSGCWSKIDGVWPFSTTSPRAATGTGCVNRDKYQWSWFLGGEQQSQQQQSRGSQEDRNHRLFVMSGGGGRVSSTLDCGECDGEGAFLSDGYSNNDTIKWKHIHTPVGFSGFPYSASSLII